MDHVGTWDRDEYEADDGDADLDDPIEEVAPAAEAVEEPYEVLSDQDACAETERQVLVMPPPLLDAAPPMPPNGAFEAPEAMKMENKYLEQVVAQQADIQRDLKRKRVVKSLPSPARQAVAYGGGGSDDTAPAVDVRVTGWWRWKTVIVPPNAYVVHTRRGRTQPVNIGLGKSFRFDPYKDAYLVVPATTQTILISANCICKERQGILVQGYVQWIIEDFGKAFTKLDFSDPYDPMGIVNTQLREQAEAAIKDTVATMSIDDVLSDKQPIIKELTRRLREVSEGDGQEEGLGIAIVTVQIKEAIVSSARLWENLQAPFRAERSKDARLAQLENEAIVHAREAEAKETTAKLEIQTQAEINQRRAETDAVVFDRNQKEKVRRARLEAEGLEEALASEKEKIAKQAEIDREKAETVATQKELESVARAKLVERQIDLDSKRQKVANDLSDEHLRLKVIEQLPEILSQMPKPKELHSVSINGDDSMTAMVAGVMKVVEEFRAKKA